ncbi:MAG TPA: ATP/GTP-binding protein [Streptosporangiaceae bacterium]|nr:ATP/GTP-binding protein [Streptosporangiaceae bacterium]
MSPRRARRLPDAAPRRSRPGTGRAGTGRAAGGSPDGAVGPEQAESWPDGDWVVRLVPGAASVKSYRCPGCDQEIPAGTAHLVAWPRLSPGPSERRHWHRPCWDRRMQRRPGRRVGR